MGLTAKKPEGSNLPPISQGLHQAVCYALYDLGHQYQERFGKTVRKVLVVWEIPGERIDIEKNGEKVNLPRGISKEYTNSLHKKAALKQALEAWRGRAFTDEEVKGFDLTKLLGANCMVQILHEQKNDKTYANVSAVVQLPKNMPKLAPENAIKHFSFEENLDSIPDGTPDWIKDKIKASEEWQEMNSDGYDERNRAVGSPSEDGDPGIQDDDQIPF